MSNHSLSNNILTIDDILTRGVENIIASKDKLAELFKSDKKLNIYLGIDPTATKIHLGHAVPLRKIQAFAELGHNVTFLIGDFTALIGDTSDKDGERPVLTYEEIEQNFQDYKKLAEKVLDFSKIKVVHNSEWLSKLTFTDVVKLCQHFSVGDFISREMIKKRMAAGTRVALHEVLYPVMQGYDSYHMDTDIQVGGTDQTFNMQAGRTLQRILRHKDSYVIATGFLEGTDGRKMSKSWDNAIWLDDEPSDMYGKIMSLRDELIIQYFTLGTNLPMNEIVQKEERLKDGENPLNSKKELALQIVTELYNEKIAQKAQESFEKSFGERNPDYIPTPSMGPSTPLIDQVAHIMQISKSEAKRLILAESVDVNGTTIKDAQYETNSGDKIKIGKRTFYHLD